MSIFYRICRKQHIHHRTWRLSFFSTSSSQQQQNIKNDFQKIGANAAAERVKRRKKETQAIIMSGVPLIIFMLGACYALSQFLETHVEMKDRQSNSKSIRKFDLEEEHEALMKRLDIDNFSLSRIPRKDGLDEDDSKSGQKQGQPMKK